MARLIVIYKTPIDPAAFVKYYSETHIPLAKKIPGLRKFEVSRGPVVSPEGSSPVHMIATLQFDSLAAIQSAFGSPEGMAAAADVQNFATNEVEMLMYEADEV